MLPNGNRVTVRIGGRGAGSSKTVTVKRRDGTGESRTYHRGPFLTWLLGQYQDNIPTWATE